MNTRSTIVTSLAVSCLLALTLTACGGGTTANPTASSVPAVCKRYKDTAQQNDCAQKWAIAQADCKKQATTSKNDKNARFSLSRCIAQKLNLPAAGGSSAGTTASTASRTAGSKTSANAVAPKKK